MDAALVAAAGISAVILKNHASFSLCAGSFFVAVFNPNAALWWQTVRLAIVMLSGPLCVNDTFHKGSQPKFSPYLSFLPIALATGDSFASSTVYPFLVLFFSVAADLAISESSEKTAYLKKNTADEHKQKK